MEALNLEIKKPLPIIVSGKTYNLEFPFKNLPALEKRLARPMRSPMDWYRVQASEFRDVIAVGLMAKHPAKAESLAKQVSEVLDNDIEACVIFHHELLVQNFPRTARAADEAIKVSREMEELGISPKVESADAR